MIKIFDCKNKNYIFLLNKLLKKNKINDKKIKTTVQKIIRDIKKSGDKALIKYEKKYSNNYGIISNKKKISELLILNKIVS